MTLIYENYKGSQSGLAEITRHNWSNMVHGLSHWIFRTSNFHWSFQNHMLVIGGWRRQDKKKKKKIVADSSCGTRRNGGNDRWRRWWWIWVDGCWYAFINKMKMGVQWRRWTCSFSSSLSFINIIRIKANKPDIADQTASQAAHSESGPNRHFKFTYHDCHIWWQKLPCPSGYLQKQQQEWSIFTRWGGSHETT